MKKRFLLGLLIVSVILSLSGCESEIFECEYYTEEEIRNIYYDNEALFEDLVEVLVSEKAFYDKGRIHEHEDADIFTPYDRELDLFSISGRQTIYDLLEFRPYMIAYDDYQQYVKITFIGKGEVESCTLMHWLDEYLYPGPEKSPGLESEIRILENHFEVMSLNESWLLYWSVK